MDILAHRTLVDATLLASVATARVCRAYLCVQS
jgi:hypothetical protein